MPSSHSNSDQHEPTSPVKQIVQPGKASPFTILRFESPQGRNRFAAAVSALGTMSASNPVPSQAAHQKSDKHKQATKANVDTGPICLDGVLQRVNKRPYSMTEQIYQSSATFTTHPETTMVTTKKEDPPQAKFRKGDHVHIKHLPKEWKSMRLTSFEVLASVFNEVGGAWKYAVSNLDEMGNLTLNVWENRLVKPKHKAGDIVKRRIDGLGEVSMVISDVIFNGDEVNYRVSFETSSL